jgi:hypothetical protein
MFLCLPDPDRLSDPDPTPRILPFSHKGVERTEIMLAQNTKFDLKAVD